MQGVSKAKPILHIMSPPCQRSSHMLSKLRTYWPFKTCSDVVQTESKLSCTWLWLLLLLPTLKYIWCWISQSAGGILTQNNCPGKNSFRIQFLGCQWSVLEGKRIICTVESVYLMIWTNCQGRKHQSIRKLLGANLLLKILCSGFYCTDNSFSLQDTPLAS